MGREISVSFALTAALKGGFKSAFQGAAASARNVASAIRDMERSPVGKLGAAMQAQREKIKGLAGSVKEARATLANLQAQARASGGATGMLARQIEMAQSRVNNLNGALNRQLAAWRTTTAQAATSGGSVRNLTQDYERLAQRMERARRVASALHANQAQADALRNQRSDLNSRLMGTIATATTIAAPIALSIGFEDQMAKVGAVSKASKEDLVALTDQARQLGRDTSFSASQAAQGMQYLAMAGFKTNQVLAAMPGMLDLAAASGTDLGRTADIASNILSAFELKAEEMDHVGDVLVAAFTSSNTTLESLGETMKYVGPIAKDAGASIEDAVAMAAMLGNVGISGSQAGTSSKAIFARLAAPPTEAAQALESLNIKTKDAQGNLRAVPDILEEITLKTASMGTADRTGVFSKVFGLEPMAGASALAKQAAQTVDENGQQIVDSMGKPTTALLKFTEELKHASDDMDGMGGASHRVATQMNATTGGALRRLKSAWEDTGISVGNLFLPAIQVAADALSTVGNFISGLVNRFPRLSSCVGLGVAAFAALTAGGLALGLVVNTVRTSMNAWRGAILRLTASQIGATGSTGALSGATGLFGVVSRVAGAGARFFAGGLRSILMASGVGALLVGLGYAVNLLIDNWDAVCGAMKKAWDWVVDTWERLGVFFTQLGRNLSAVFDKWGISLSKPFIWAKNFIVGAWNGITSFFSSLWRGIPGFFSDAWNAIVSGAIWVKQAVTGMFLFARDMIVGAWNGIKNFFSAIWNGVVAGATWVKDAVVAYFTMLKDFYVGAFNFILNTVKSVWNGIVTGATWVINVIVGAWNGIVGFFGSLWQGVVAGVTVVKEGIIGAFVWAKDTVIGVWNSITGFFTSIWQGVGDGANWLGDAIGSAFTWASDTVIGIWDGVLGFFEGVWQNLSDGVGWIENEIISAFTWVKDSVVAVWQTITEFFAGVWNSIGESCSWVWQGIVDWASWAIDGVMGIWNGVTDFFGGIVDSISDTFSGFFSWIKDKFQWVFDTIDAISSFIDDITGSVSDAKSKAFGDESPAKAANKAAESAEKKAATSPVKNKPKPAREFTPVKAQPVEANKTKGGSRTKGSRSGGGGGRRSGGGSRGGSSAPASGGGESSGGPVTVVTLAGDNSKPVTQFFPSGAGAATNAANAMKGASGSSGLLGAVGGLVSGVVNAVTGGFGASLANQAMKKASDIPYALPQSPGLIAGKTGDGKNRRESPTSINIDLKQQFDLITEDGGAVRKILESIKPDMEALVRKALDKMQSDKRRTAYAQ